MKKKAFAVKSQNIKQKIRMQLIFIMETKLQKKYFLEKYEHFSASRASILNPCLDDGVHIFSKTQEKKNKTFLLNSEKIKLVTTNNLR